MNVAAESALVHSMGQNGFKYLSTAGTATYSDNNTTVIQILSDCDLTCTSVRGDSLTSVSLTAGSIIVGEFSSVTCAGAGGSLLAYLAKRI